METIDRTLLFNLNNQINQWIKEGAHIDLDKVLNKDGEKVASTCIRVLCSYQNKPSVITPSNCDLWWSVIVCMIDDHNVGGAYGYSRKLSVQICNAISKHVMWLLMNVDKEIVWSHNDLNVIKALISRGIHSKSQAENLFKKASDKYEISFLNQDEWVSILYKGGIRGKKINDLRKEVERKLNLKSKKSSVKSSNLGARKSKDKEKGINDRLLLTLS